MPTELEQQLARFAESLDREAPTISVDGIVTRGTVALAVDLDEIGAREVPIEVALTVATRRPDRRRVPSRVALGVAAAAVLVVALAVAAVWVGGEADPAYVPSSIPPTIVRSYTSADGEVTVSAPSTWETWLPGKFNFAGSDVQGPDAWLGRLSRSDDYLASGDRIEFIDPVAYDAWCADNGGNPLLSAPADAAAIAQQVIADPNFETTAPLATSIGGVEAVSIDVTLAPDGQACGIGMIDIPRWIHTIGWDPGLRLRLYLVDLPAGMSVQTLAITVVAPEERFDDVIAETAPIIDSIEFHPPFPAMATTFVSPTYGYSFKYFDRGGLQTATEIWDAANQPPIDIYGWDPRFDGVETGSAAYFEAASTPIPGGVSIDEWVDTSITPRSAGGCGTPRSEQEEIVVDGQPGRKAECDHSEATVVAGGRLYLFIGPNDERRWFDAWIATIELTPETAAVS